MKRCVKNNFFLIIVNIKIKIHLSIVKWSANYMILMMNVKNVYLVYIELEIDKIRYYAFNVIFMTVKIVFKVLALKMMDKILLIEIHHNYIIQNLT